MIDILLDFIWKGT